MHTTEVILQQVKEPSQEPSHKLDWITLVCRCRVNDLNCLENSSRPLFALVLNHMWFNGVIVGNKQNDTKEPVGEKTFTPVSHSNTR